MAARSFRSMAAPHGARSNNQPTAEIYQVAIDDQFPYRIYGAQQDNTTVIVPSLPLGNGQEFRDGPGCETGPIIPKMGDPNIVWGGCKGQFSRLNINTNNNEQRYWVGGESLYGNEPAATDLSLPACRAHGDLADRTATPFITARNSYIAPRMVA